MNTSWYAKGFTRGSTTYTCYGCGRRTRQVGDEPEGVCFHCYELQGIDNHYCDGGDGGQNMLKEAVTLLKRCQDKGGKVTEADFPNIPFPTTK